MNELMNQLYPESYMADVAAFSALTIVSFIIEVLLLVAILIVLILIYRKL